MAATVAAGEATSAAVGVAESWFVVIWLWASLRFFIRSLIWSCIAEIKRSILESVCSSRTFSILRARQPHLLVCGTPIYSLLQPKVALMYPGMRQ